MRLIDSNALIGLLHNVTFEDGTDREIVYRCVELAPTIEERKTGKWINDEHDIPHCSCCQYIPAYDTALDDIFYSKYCPECGAKMEVDE